MLARLSQWATFKASNAALIDSARNSPLKIETVAKGPHGPVCPRGWTSK
jgi:hypothetical protein